MSLPAGQQRVLDKIEDDLQVAEPRLASMYAIFTRLTKNESPPCREQLPAHARRYRLTGRRRCLSVRGMVLAIAPRGSRVTRVVLLTQLVAVLAVVGLLIGLSAHAARNGCTRASAMTASVLHWRNASPQCPQVPPGAAVPSK